MEIKKALTFRASSIGDALMGKYLLDNIHVQYPNARLGIVVAGRAAMLRDLFAAYPHIEVVEANRRNLRSLWHLWQQWRQSDLVVTQYAGKVGGSFSFSTKLMARLLARKGALVGFADASALNTFVYDHLLPDPQSHSPAEDERRALRVMGLTVGVAYPNLAPPFSKEGLKKFNLVPNTYVLVHLFSGSRTRGMSPKKRRELLLEICNTLPVSTELIVTGTAGEREEAKEVAGTEARVVAGEVSLGEMLQLVQNAAVVVSLDTGLGHIAAQLHRPVCIVSTCMGLWWWNEEQYGAHATYRVFSAPLHTIAQHVLVEYPPCLNDVSVQEVAQATAAMIV